MKIQKIYTSAIGKLYQEVQENSHLDKIVTDLYSVLEFEIKTGQKLPIKVNAEEVTVKLNSTDLSYIENKLKELGCFGVFVIGTMSGTTYRLEDLV